MKGLAKYFLQGILYITPISVTIFVLYWLFEHLDGLFDFYYPGVGILVMLIVITAIGYLGSFLIQTPFFAFIDNKLEHAPLIKLIYTSVKDLVKAFVGQKKSFDKPVMVKLYENSEIRRLGFITDKELAMLDEDTNMITVYLPHSFAISGQLFLVPKHYITPINTNSADTMKYIVAGGVTKIDEHD